MIDAEHELFLPPPASPRANFIEVFKKNSGFLF